MACGCVCTIVRFSSDLVRSVGGGERPRRWVTSVKNACELVSNKVGCGHALLWCNNILA